MKIAPLLAQYLYNHKRLDLPGLGSFMLDPAVIIEPDSKSGKPLTLEGVSFEANAAIRESPELVQFISTQTGKIKALAAADLESHLGLAQQFLNIGKPYLFEGIGSLVKIRFGEYTFTSGQAISLANRDQPLKENRDLSGADDSFHDYKSVFYPKKVKTKWKKPAAIFLLVAGLGLAIWGGYTVYKNTMSKQEDTIAEEKKDQTILIQDTSATIKNDTPGTSTTQYTVTDLTTPVAGNFKFVLETSTAKRAFSRFDKLKNFQWNVQMETKDSLSYTLFMLLPASSADTTRLIDSLSMLNGRRVYIEPSYP